MSKKDFDDETMVKTEQTLEEMNQAIDEMEEEEFETIFEVSDADINASLNAIDSSNDSEAEVVKKLKKTSKKTLSQLADEIVANYVNNRNDKNWQKLMEFFWYGLKQFAFGFVHNQDDAYDMTIETFANAYEKFDRYNPEKKFSTWLWSICKYNCINFLKKSSRIPLVDTDIADVYDSALLENSYSNDISAAEYRVDVNHSIKNVSSDEITLEMYHNAIDEIEKYKGVAGQIMKMKLVDDMKIKDIAVALNMNESTVKNHLYKGKRNIEKILRINHKDVYTMYINANQEEDNNLYA